MANGGYLPEYFPFYDFLPYNYGAFSFTLARELQILENYGYITGDEKSVWIRPDMLGEVRKIIGRAPTELCAAVVKVLSAYGAMTQQMLLKTVYVAHPSFTYRSKLKDLIPPSAKEPDPASLGVYTMGYQGRSVDGFFQSILQNGIKNIIDVRANPVSRKYGFAKSTLSLISKKLHVGYQHIPQLGISSDARKGLGTVVTYKALLDDYESRILPERIGARRMAIQAALSMPSVLVCMEEDPCNCHRGRLATSMSVDCGLPTHHL